MARINRAVVEAARARAVANPGILVQGTLAKDSDGYTCDPTDPTASCFCTLGLVCNEAGLSVRASLVDEYDFIAKTGFDYASRDGVIEQVIQTTDSEYNVLDNVEAACNAGEGLRTPRVAGLAGFDLLLKAMDDEAK